MTATAVACAMVAGLSVAYAVEEFRRRRSGRLFPFVGRRQAARRVFGSLLVAALMVLVYIGLEVIDPHVTPRRFVMVWGMAAMGTVLLFALALFDLRELRVHRERARAQALQRSVVPGADPGSERSDPSSPA